jgi:hypothetical protein
MRHVGLFVAVSWLIVGGMAWALDITACGAVVPANEIGILQADVSGCPVGVTLERNATLQMNGHAIMGSDEGVRCHERRCIIVGPGEIVGAGMGIAYNDSLSGTRSNRIYVNDVVVRESRDYGIHAFGRIIATNLSVRNAMGGFGYGIYAFDLRGTNVSVTDNPERAIEIARLVQVTGLTVTGNGEGGLSATKIDLTDSVLTGNEDFDLLTPRRPRLTNTSCGRSAGRDGDMSISWGVCTDDPIP